MRVKRRIRGKFHHKCFKPCGIPNKDLETIILRKDEIEAIRLMDLNGLYQEEVAKEMNVSRPTISRILASAREKIAKAIIEGKALEIED